MAAAEPSRTRTLGEEMPPGVVSSEIEQVIKFFGSRHEAERMLDDVLRDQPEWVDAFRIERIELGRESLN